MIEKPITTDKLYISTIPNQSRWEKGERGEGGREGERRLILLLTCILLLYRSHSN